MRADRLLSILLLLQNRGKLTTNELAQELEVTGRTIHRDMEALSAAGIPIVAERGKSGGWSLLEQYRTNLTGLKANELKSLLISPSFQLLTDLGLTKDWHEARQKILASIPSALQKNSHDIWNRVHVDTTTWRQSPEKIESFKILQQAIWDERKLQIKYERADGKCIERVVSPLGLVAKGSTWYLIASANEKVRNYRASRIKSVSLTDELFSRPNDFDLTQYWNDSTKEFIKSLPKYEVDVEISSSIVPRIKFTGRFVQILKMDSPSESGWIPAKLCFDTEQEASEYILGFGDQIKIIRPNSLKQNIYDMAKRIVDFYEQED
ncbi:YafY family transcriptional regulator [Bacillus sp. FJAT-49705]|uniref:YafY family transcriptional regulator n=1 Tax=Cytobacillus citreus TaxID=2833586 RepID=A0ABS5NZ87_9BACI|nr:YafY family protein [Cytobacillus citreus]MBS4193142.1 YafY family transcriptional regulator [Cytobacillus citreus]